jgi:competence protein ComEC
LLSAWLPLSLGIAFLICGFLFLTAAIGCLKVWRGNYWIICLLFLVTGLALARFAYAQINPVLLKYCGHWVTVEGTVSREADVRPEYVNYYLSVRNITLAEERYTLNGRLLVKVPAPCPVYSYGDFLRINGLLERPPEPGNPGAFNYRSYLERHGVSAILRTDNIKNVARVGVEGNFPVRCLLLFKEKLLNVARQTLDPVKSALVNGIVFGVQGEIPRDIWQIFSQTGIVHILSVSGMHVGLVLAGISLLLRLLRVPRKWFTPLSSVFLILYAALSGMGPAVMRATFMGLLFLWAHYMGRDQDWPTTLSAAAFFCLLVNPLSLYDIGFQLSFVSTWGILYLHPVLNKMLEPAGLWPNWLKAVTSVTLSAQLATLPLIVWYYNIVSPVSLLTNIVAAPLTGVILAIGIAAALVGIIYIPLASLINASNSLAVEIFLKLVSIINHIPGGVIFLPTPPLPAVMAWYPFLCLAVMSLRKEKWVCLKEFLQQRTPKRNFLIIFIIALSFGLIIFCTTWMFSQAEKNELTLHLIDVGQGDSILIQTPSGKNILVDAGGWNGEFDTRHGAGDSVVVPYLRRLGVRRLNTLVLTHPHEDHAAGAIAVSEAFPVDLAVVSPLGFYDIRYENLNAANFQYCIDNTCELAPGYIHLLTSLANRQTPIYAVCAGDKIKCDPALDISVLAPPFPILKGTHSDFNNASLVLLIKYGDQSFLLTGDIEIETQEWLLKSGVDFQVDVFKVPHHGSRYYSPPFFENARSSLALISVGARNRFNMPADETIEQLKNHAMSIYRTDEHGAVTLITDGKNLKVKTYKRK